jgi:hypothetical protein
MPFILNENEFINKSIINYFKKTKLIFKYKNTYFNINFYSIKFNINKINKIKKCIKRIKILLNKLNNNFYFNIIIIDYPIKKKPIDNKYYINSAYTYLTNNKNKHIIIYRYSEISKVLIHEILHHFYIFKLNDVIYKNDPLNRKIIINYNEAIVEFLATIYQCYFTNTNINDEIKYNKLIAENILNINLNNSSYIYSYIVIKYILMINYKNVLKNLNNKKWIYNYIDNYKLLLKNKKTINNYFDMVSCSNL